ncbi:MAG TPA: hypothetical protein PKH77_28090 [Anaerolineae bacterium]|nr:hypothetical protein [Anaerolineae bacterium]
MKTIAITSFLSLIVIILCMVLGLRWLDHQYGPTAVVVAVVAICLALFMVVIAVILSLFGLVQFRIFTQAIGDVAETQSLNARNFGKLLGNIRQTPNPVSPPAEIDAAWWRTGEAGVLTGPTDSPAFSPARTRSQLSDDVADRLTVS